MLSSECFLFICSNHPGRKRKSESRWSTCFRIVPCLSRRSRFAELRTSTKKSRKTVVSMVATTTTFDLTIAAGEHAPSSTRWRQHTNATSPPRVWQLAIVCLRSRRSSYQPWYSSSYRQECATEGQGWREADFCNLALWYFYQMSSHLGNFCWFTFSKHRCQANLSYGWKMWRRVRDGGYVSIFPQGWCSKLHVSFWGCRDKHTYILRVLFSHGFHVNAPMLQFFFQVTPQKRAWDGGKTNWTSFFQHIFR